MARQKTVPVLLPEVPRDLATPADRKRTRSRESARRRAQQGKQLVSAVVFSEEITFLMSEWGFRDKAEMVRVALRYLAAETRGGLTSITVPEMPSQ